MEFVENELKYLQITPLDEDKEEIEVDEGDFEDEEEEEEAVVTLGFVEKPNNPRFLLRHLFPSKAGGVPAWLDPVYLPSENYYSCGFCGEPLQFLLQVYAPISGKAESFHRMLYVFMCPSMACLLRDQHEQWKPNIDNPCRSVMVFRCQLSRENPFYSSEPPRHDGTDKPLSAGATLCSWCATWKGAKVCSSCRKACYCSEKHQGMHWKSGHRNKCHQIINSLEYSSLGSSSNKDRLPATNKGACNASWPEYEIIIQDEYVSDVDVSEDNIRATSLVPKHHKTDDTCELQLKKFEADDDKMSLASFQARISRAPEQVLRYCRDPTAKPLWPLATGRPSKANIPKCKYCQGPLSYEFQIMPQLLYFFGVRNDLDSLDWATIAVFTCLASCESNISYKEEFAWVQLYPTSALA